MSAPRRECDVWWGPCACGTWHCPGMPDGEQAEDECRRRVGMPPKLRLVKRA